MSDTPSEPKRGNFAKHEGEVVLREHEYDGIQEFDQKLPNWWLFTFYGAIILFVVYWFLYYQAHGLKTDREVIMTEMNAIHEKKAKELEATLASLDDQTLINTWAVDQSIIKSGEAIYATYCLPCHGADLSATMAGNPLPGRSLIDGVWEYGNKPMDLFKIINQGSPVDAVGLNGAKMQPWGQMLTPKQVAEVTAFIISKNQKEFAAVPQ